MNPTLLKSHVCKLPNLLLGVGMFFGLGCHSEASLEPNERYISRAMLRNQWPFSVDAGVLRCAANPLSPAMPAVTFISAGTTYGINGGALTGNAYPDVDKIMLKTDIGLYKVSLGDLIHQGLDLCKSIDEAHRPVFFRFVHN